MRSYYDQYSTNRSQWGSNKNKHKRSARTCSSNGRSTETSNGREHNREASSRAMTADAGMRVAPLLLPAFSPPSRAPCTGKAVSNNGNLNTTPILLFGSSCTEKEWAPKITGTPTTHANPLLCLAAPPGADCVMWRETTHLCVSFRPVPKMGPLSG